MYKAATTTLYFTWDCFGKSYHEKCKQKFCSVKALFTNVSLNSRCHTLCSRLFIYYGKQNYM